MVVVETLERENRELRAVLPALVEPAMEDRESEEPGLCATGRGYAPDEGPHQTCS